MALLGAVQALPAAAQTLRIGLIEDVDTLDPAQGRTFGGRQVFTALCSKLFDIDKGLNIVPQLVTSHSIAADNLSVNLVLKRDVAFHDGTPFNAAAVKANIERQLTMAESARKGDIRAVSRVDVVDDHAAKIVLSEPFAPLLAQLADRPGMMVSTAAANAAGPAAFGLNPVCSGPYKFSRRVIQDRIVLDKNKDHWASDKFAYQQVVYLPIPDGTVRLNNLLAGQLDLIEQVAATDVPKLKQTRGFAVSNVTGLGHFHVLFNVGNGPRAAGIWGKDDRLRRALELSIDRATINNVVFNDLFVPGNQPVSPESRFYAASLPVPKRDVAAAKALLQQAGQPNPSVTMVVNNSPVFVQVGEVIQTMAREAGINVTVQPMEATTAGSTTRAGNFEAFLTFWSGRVDPDGNVYTYLGCTGVQNDGKYCNQEVERLIDNARKVNDAGQRRSLYEQAAKIWMKDMPLIYLYHPNWFFGHVAGLKNFTPVPDGLMRLEGVTN
jgi:peptide/nickel transport system substrate-binding protein